jgi:hypothetical protein
VRIEYCLKRREKGRKNFFHSLSMNYLLTTLYQDYVPVKCSSLTKTFSKTFLFSIFFSFLLTYQQILLVFIMDPNVLFFLLLQFKKIRSLLLICFVHLKFLTAMVSNDMKLRSMHKKIIRQRSRSTRSTRKYLRLRLSQRKLLSIHQMDIFESCGMIYTVFS